MPEQGVRLCNALKKDITKHTPAAKCSPAKTAAASLFRRAQAVPTATIARTVFAACTSTRNPATEHPPAAG